jgi:hypothetical protein
MNQTFRTFFSNVRAEYVFFSQKFDDWQQRKDSFSEKSTPGLYKKVAQFFQKHFVTLLRKNTTMKKFSKWLKGNYCLSWSRGIKLGKLEKNPKTFYKAANVRQSQIGSLGCQKK